MRVVRGNDLKGASQVAGWVGMQADLNTVNDMCLLAWDLLGRNVDNIERTSAPKFTMLQSLYVSAVITYVRCLNAGARTRLSEQHIRLAAAGQAGQAIEAHRSYVAIRDRHVAHSVSPLEECHVGIAITNDEPAGVKPVCWTHVALGLQPCAFPSLGKLAQLLLPVAAERIAKAAARVEDEARGLDPVDLAGRPSSSFVPPGASDAHESRTSPRDMPESGAWELVTQAIVHDVPQGSCTTGPDRGI